MTTPEELHALTATEVLPLLRRGDLKVETYARALLDRIQRRDPAVRAWAWLSPTHILSESARLDALPASSRGPLHGLPIGIKDVILTRDMPTQYNSPLFESETPIAADANVVMSLRALGALVFGKTATTEFACSKRGGVHQNFCRNCWDEGRTPGGSSSGSGAAVGDGQVPVAVGTQTGGSVVRPASFNGCYGFKPTWGAISREGLGQWSITLDTCGFFARSPSDLTLLADALAIHDDTPPPSQPFTLKGAKIGFFKSPYWPNAGPGTRKAWSQARELLQAHGAAIHDLQNPTDDFDKILDWHTDVLTGEGKSSFLGHSLLARQRDDPTQILGDDIRKHLENRRGVTNAALLAAYDNLARQRPAWDALASQYDLVITPSVVDEAPQGLENTGDMNFCSTWTVLHTPVVNLPGFAGEHGLPVGLTAVGARYQDRRLLRAVEVVGDIFEKEGRWRSGQT